MVFALHGALITAAAGSTERNELSGLDGKTQKRKCIPPLKNALFYCSSEELQYEMRVLRSNLNSCRAENQYKKNDKTVI